MEPLIRCFFHLVVASSVFEAQIFSTSPCSWTLQSRFGY
jgi:hypothetical protein